jgi:hypothetical protein
MMRIALIAGALALLTACGGGEASTTEVWQAPSCAAVSGTSAVTYTTNEGSALAPRIQSPTAGTRERVSGLVAMPAVANLLFAVHSTGNGQVGGTMLM